MQERALAVDGGERRRGGDRPQRRLGTTTGQTPREGPLCGHAVEIGGDGAVDPLDERGCPWSTVGRDEGADGRWNRHRRGGCVRSGEFVRDRLRGAEAQHGVVDPEHPPGHPAERLEAFMIEPEVVARFDEGATESALVVVDHHVIVGEVHRRVTGVVTVTPARSGSWLSGAAMPLSQ